MTEEELVFPIETRSIHAPISLSDMSGWLYLAYKAGAITTNTVYANQIIYALPAPRYIGYDCPVLTRLGYLAKPSKSKSRYVLTDKGKAWLVAYIMEHGSVE